LKTAIDMLSGKQRKISVETLAKGFMGLTDAEGKPFLSKEEQENLMPLILLSQLQQAIADTGLAESYPLWRDSLPGLAPLLHLQKKWKR